MLKIELFKPISQPLVGGGIKICENVTQMTVTG